MRGTKGSGIKKSRGLQPPRSSSNFSPVSFGRRTEIPVHHTQTRQSFRATLRINLATAKNLACLNLGRESSYMEGGGEEREKKKNNNEFAVQQ